MLLGFNVILLPSFLAFPYPLGALSFAGLFRVDFKFGNFYFDLANVKFFSNGFNSARTLKSLLFQESGALTEDGLPLRRE